MNILIKSSNGITLVPADSRLLSLRKIFIEGDITAEGACEFAKKILLLNQESRDAYIDVLINSPGGEMNAGMLMYDAIQASRAPVRMFCLGRAYSMGAIIFASGSHGRYMLPHSELMIHEPLLGNQICGNSSSIRSVSESLLEAKRKMIRILAKHTGKSEAEVEQATSYDHYFSPEESMEFGLCDEITGFDRFLEDEGQ